MVETSDDRSGPGGLPLSVSVGEMWRIVGAAIADIAADIAAAGIGGGIVDGGGSGGGAAAAIGPDAGLAAFGWPSSS